MTSPRFAVQARSRGGRAWWHWLTSTGTLVSTAAQAQTFGTRADAERALAQARQLAPSSIWRVTEHRSDATLPLVRSAT